MCFLHLLNQVTQLHPEETISVNAMAEMDHGEPLTLALQPDKTYLLTIALGASSCRLYQALDQPQRIQQSELLNLLQSSFPCNAPAVVLPCA